MSTIRLILHGKAAARPAIREGVQKLRDQGAKLQVRVTWEGGDTQRLAREAVADGVSTIVAGGGDGTLNEVATAMVGLGICAAELPSFGILPLGTANDFARSCGIPLDPLEALKLVVESVPVPIDLGRDGGRSFINVATGGVGTEITVETSEDLKRFLGGAAYFVTALKRLGKLTATEVSFRGPGFDWTGPMAVLGIGNGRQAGGGNILCPEACIDDGLLEIRILPDVAAEERQAILKELVSDGLSAIERRVIFARVPWIELQSEVPIQINLDGEPVREKTFRFEAARHVLRAHLPSDCPLISKGGQADPSDELSKTTSPNEG